jgi:hypothetical protein
LTILRLSFGGVKGNLKRWAVQKALEVSSRMMLRSMKMLPQGAAAKLKFNVFRF